MSATFSSQKSALYGLVLLSGMAALSWQVLWQVKSSLALGVSALGTAITLAASIGGMSLGSWLMGRWLSKHQGTAPQRLYGLCEIFIGLCGLLLIPAFNVVEMVDTLAYRSMPEAYGPMHLAAILAVLGLPALCMGATFPLFGLMSRQFSIKLSELYGLNTLGAAAGVLIIAFILIPLFGMAQTVIVVAGLNIVVGVMAFLLRPRETVSAATVQETAAPSGLSPQMELWLIALTGLATFVLEVAWFRILTAALRSTTDAFAIMLSCFLLGLGAAGQIAPALKRSNIPLGLILACSGIGILVATPLIERFEYIALVSPTPEHLLFNWFFLTLLVLGTPIFLLGIAFPWIMDGQKSPARWGNLYAVNTFCSIVAAIGTAWVLLPSIGATRSAWLVGIVVAATGVALSASGKRPTLIVLLLTGAVAAYAAETGVGKTRAVGSESTPKLIPSRLLAHHEGPEATVAAVEYPDNIGRGLMIDGFVAATQMVVDGKVYDRYMEWMGHLPMLLHPNPQNALVICFGTGQTTNAVRRENPTSLDIVDINANVFKLAHFFSKNQNVLGDSRVHPIVMDGRAYMRRTEKAYDIITLEPMPPNFAGVNALYSQEFYQLAHSKLREDGMIAQWVPFHLVPPSHIAAIVNTFRAVFPNAALWIDPVSNTGILLGGKNNAVPVTSQWPGFARNVIERTLTEAEVRKAVMFDQAGLKLFDGKGIIVTDDNQNLAYGEAVLYAKYSYFGFKDTLDYIGYQPPGK